MADLEPVTPPEPVDTPAIDDTPEPSLAEHEAEFGRGRGTLPTESTDDEPPAPKAARGADGKFVKAEKPEKHRAAKAEATPADVPRIAELTRKLREAERERDEARAARADRAMVVPGVSQPAGEQDRRVPEPTAAVAKPEPNIKDFQEYTDYVKALFDWKIAEARRQDREERQRETAQTELVSSWKTRVDTAKGKHDDFEQVALQAPTKIPQGSLVDAWILEDDDGAEVLYELQKDDLAGGHLLTDILAGSPLKQAKMLSQLALRLSPSTRPQAAVTGAAVATVTKAAPRPPTPVRTSAMPMADEPPDAETSSLAEHEKFYGRASRR